MSFADRLLARAQGSAPMVRPRPRTPFEAGPAADEPEIVSDDVTARTSSAYAPPRPEQAPASARPTTPDRGVRRSVRSDPRVPGAVVGAPDVEVRDEARQDIVVREREPARTTRAQGTPARLPERAVPEPDRPRTTGGPRTPDRPAMLRAGKDVRATEPQSVTVQRAVSDARAANVFAPETRIAPKPRSSDPPRPKRGERRETATPTSTDPVIRIHIGRIEVRAERETVPPPKPVRAPAAARLTVEEYSRQRARGER